jgi:glycosyltransferase involved in cell wall biosynthesis
MNGAMISVVIPTLNSAAALSATLACLVGAAVDGLVKEVLVVDGGSTDATLELADDAGARILREGGSDGERLALACKAARGDWLLVLAPGTRLAVGWERAVADHLAAGHDGIAVFGSGLGLGGWVKALVGMPSPSQGLLIRRDAYERLGGYRDVGRPHLDLVRRIGRGRIRRLALSVA